MKSELFFFGIALALLGAIILATDTNGIVRFSGFLMAIIGILVSVWVIVKNEKVLKATKSNPKTGGDKK